jgi:hypothetical protein
MRQQRLRWCSLSKGDTRRGTESVLSFVSAKRSHFHKIQIVVLNYKDSAKLLSALYKIDQPTMEIVEKRGGERSVLPVNDEVLSGLQRMADTFHELKIIPKKIDVKDKNYNWVPDQKW